MTDGVTPCSYMRKSESFFSIHPTFNKHGSVWKSGFGFDKKTDASVPQNTGFGVSAFTIRRISGSVGSEAEYKTHGVSTETSTAFGSLSRTRHPYGIVFASITIGFVALVNFAFNHFCKKSEPPLPG